MRILFITAAFPPLRAGEAEFAAHVCEKLVALGCSVSVVTTRGATPSEHRQVTLHPIMEDWSWRELPRLAAAMRHTAPDAVFLYYGGWTYQHHPMITFAATLSHRLLPGVPFVTEFAIVGGANARGVATRMIRKLATRLVSSPDVDWEYGTLLRDSDAVIAMSVQHRDFFAARLGSVRQRTEVIPPPPLMRLADVNDGTTRLEARAALGIASGDFLLAFYGYIYPDKGVETLFHALQRIRERRSNVRLVIIGGSEGGFEAGTPYFRDISAMPERLGISDGVIWTGAYDSAGDFASRCLRGADACVLPFAQGVTLNRSSVAAAAAHGLPIVTTRGSEMESQFVDRENVLVCPPHDAEALATAIGALIDSVDLQRRLSEGALQLSRDCFFLGHRNVQDDDAVS